MSGPQSNFGSAPADGVALHRPPAMTDVAARAGVSHQTVSRVINGLPNVSTATRERVLAAIEELGYRPNFSARALATARTSTIGLVMSRGVDYGPSSIVLAVGTAAQNQGYSISMAPLARLDNEATLDAVEHLISQGVEGIIVVASHVAVAETIDQHPPACPTVMIISHAAVPAQVGLSYAGIDQRRGVELAMDYLMGMGHSNIYHLAGPDEWFDAKERRLAYTQAMERAGFTPHVIPGFDWTARSGYLMGEQVARAVRMPGGPSAVLAANDAVAIGLISALRDAHLSVPGDVSVVGFDDIELAAFCVPALTTVAQPFTELGSAAVALLLQALAGSAGDGQPKAEFLEPSLVVRRSVTAMRYRPLAS